MRLARIGPPGQEVPVVAGDDGRWRDLRDLTADVDGDLLAGGLDRVADALARARCPRSRRTRTGSARRWPASARSSASG